MRFIAVLWVFTMLMSIPASAQVAFGTPWVRPGIQTEQQVPQQYTNDHQSVQLYVIPLMHMSPELIAYILGGDVIYDNYMSSGSGRGNSGYGNSRESNGRSSDTRGSYR